MFRLALAATCCALAVGTAAQAQVTIGGSATSTTTVDGSTGTPQTGTGVVIGESGTSAYSSQFNIGAQSITFESGSTMSGSAITTTSTSRIDLNVTNTADGRIAPTLLSQITAAGMGVYIGDNSTGQCFTGAGCAQARDSLTFSSFANSSTAIPLAETRVDFQVLQDNKVLYETRGSLEYIALGGQVFTINNTANADNVVGANSLTALNGFVTLDKFGFLNPNGTSDSALGFAWDATDIGVNLNTIGSGSTSNISYVVNVQTQSDANCVGTDCLVAYAGFGDPIGRGGDISTLSAIAFSGFSRFSFAPVTGPNFIGGVNFSPETFSTAGFDVNGNLVLNPTGPGGVPEPATWMSMILGFGLLGAALRRRRVFAYG